VDDRKRGFFQWDAVTRSILHALELAEEDATKWCANLTDAEIWELVKVARWSRVPARTVLLEEDAVGGTLLFLAKGDLRAAAASLTKAIALREDPDAYSNLGYCYYFLGEYDKAADCNRRATELRPAVATYWSNLADACRWSQSCRKEVDRDYKKAIDLLRQDLSVNPESARAHATIAVCLAATGSRSEADQHMKKALELDPENPTRMYQAARVAKARGDTAESVAWLKRALSAGYQRFEIERDPEFNDLRGSETFRALLKKTPQAT